MLQLYDTLSRTKRPLKLLASGKAGIYSCGPTVYRDVHIGNLRTYLLADWLRRTLEAQAVDVHHVKNITDVGHMRQEMLDRGEDKVVAAAIKAGKTPEEIAGQYTESFFQDEAALNIRPAHDFPRATEYVDEMIDVIERLVANGLAYEVDGNVYYRVAGFAGYGKLSGNTGESLLEGVRAEADPLKEDPRDFALWKAAEEGRTSSKWPSPWGEGFPGWHIECSAMSTKLLGERFDIHTGGVDNIFPHHEDEIAQSEGALGHEVVGHWVHGQHLLVDGLKMAKSTGNVYTLSQLTKRGFDPLAFRYLCATVHYRKRLNFTLTSLRAATAGLSRLRQEAFLAATASDGSDQGGEEWSEAFWSALKDDLHLPRALAATWRLVRSDASAATKARLLREFDEVLGLELLPSEIAVPAEVARLVEERDALRTAAKFEKADELRARIEAQGYHVRDTDDGSVVTRAPLTIPEPTNGTLHSSEEIPSWLSKPDEVDFTVVLTGHDDLEGLRRSTEAVLRNDNGHAIEVVVVDNGSTDGTVEWLRQLADEDDRVRPVFCDHNIGIGAARNCGMRAARGRVVVLLDTSVEPTGDFLSKLGKELEDGSTGIVGPFGVNSEDMRDFEDAPGPEVDAVEGYLMAIRRERVREVGLMDEKFRFYRHLDLDYSLAVREAGYHNRIVPDLPIRRHPHTDWERTPQEERDRLSKRNFYRFLKKYGHSTDLLLAKST